MIMSEQMQKDIKRVQDSVGRMADRATTEGKNTVGKLIGHFADLMEHVEKTVIPVKKEDATKK